MIFVTSCDRTGPVTVIQSECIYDDEIVGEPSDVDVISDKLLIAISKHNEKFKEFCNDKED